jgi:hypothetical protein
MFHRETAATDDWLATKDVGMDLDAFEKLFFVQSS